MPRLSINSAITTVHQAFKNATSFRQLSQSSWLRSSFAAPSKEMTMRARPTRAFSREELANAPTRSQVESSFSDWARRKQAYTPPARTSMASDKGSTPLPPPTVRGPDFHPPRSWDPNKITQKMDLAEFRRNLRRRKTDL